MIKIALIVFLFGGALAHTWWDVSHERGDEKERTSLTEDRERKEHDPRGPSDGT